MVWKRTACITGALLLCTGLMLAASPPHQDPQYTEKRPSLVVSDPETNQLKAEPALPAADKTEGAVQPADVIHPSVIVPAVAMPSTRENLVLRPLAPEAVEVEQPEKLKAQQMREGLSPKELADLYGVAYIPSDTELRPVFGMGAGELRQGGDTCAAATVIPGLPYSAAGDTCAAADNYNEVCPFTQTGGRDVVYVYTPAANTTVDISLCGNSAYDTKLYVYAGTCPAPGSGQQVACSDDACSTPSFPNAWVSRVEGVSLTAGVAYYIIVDGYSSADCGAYTIDVTEAAPPPPPQTCPANSLFGQDPSVPADAWSFGVADSDFNLSGSVGGLQRWESFTNPGTICDIHWWGIKAFNDGSGFTQCSESPMAFYIDFHADAGGMPGGLVNSYTASLSGTPTGILFSGFEMYAFDLDLTAAGCVSLTSGWVSIQGGGDSPSCWFLWASHGSAGDPGAAHVFDLNDGMGMQTDDYDLAVCLTGAAPEGACCDNATGNCQDTPPVSYFDCQGPDDRFLAGGMCADFDPVCGLVLGACCDPATGTCSPDKPEAECDALYGPGNWHANTSCTPNPCPLPGPSNDACVDAIAVTDGIPAVAGDNTAASATDDAEVTCQANSNKDLWYVYTATCTGTVHVDTENSTQSDTVLGVFDACGGNQIACDDDSGTGLWASLNFNGIAGTMYWIRLASYSTGSGPFVINISCTAAPTGACCQGDACSQQAQFQCAGAGGSYVGDGIACDPNPCVVGACCFADGSCQVLSEMDCFAAGGYAHQGGGTTCTPNPCPQPCACTSTVNTYPYCEAFTTGFGAWTQSTADQRDWTRLSGATPSGSTGPTGDHTTGTGFYLYYETSSPTAPGNLAILNGPCFDLSSLTTPQLTFWYHMWGATMGTLRVDVTNDNCLSWTTLWQLSGNQGNSWFLAVVDLSDYAGDTIIVRFVGIAGTSFTSDMAIDDVCVDEAQVFNGGCCDLDTGNCLGFIDEATCLAMGNTTWTAGADCTVSNFCPQPPPPNDNCPNAIPISDGAPAVSGNNSTASMVDSAEASCQSSSNKDVWYVYTATCSGLVTMDTEGSTQSDTVLSVWTACGGTEIACDDDSGTGLLSRLTFNATAGTMYWVRLASFGSAPAGGPFRINISCASADQGACCYTDGSCQVQTQTDCTNAGGTYQGGATVCSPNPCPQPPPPNDNCSGAIAVTDGMPAASGNNVSASATDDAEVSCQLNSNKDVWYVYTATCTGTIHVDTEGSTQSDTVLGIFDACGGNELACDDDSGTGLQASLDFLGFQGTMYWIRMATYGSGTGGPFVINISCTEAPQGACCYDGPPSCSVEYDIVCDATGGQFLGDGVPCGGDCDMDGVPDSCDIALGDPDCNNNGLPDSCDIAAGTSTDLDGNGVPDDCDPDCNTNGIPDGCDVSCDGGCAGVPGCGLSPDCQPDGVPDECQLGRPVRVESLLYSQAVIPDDTGVGPGGLLAIGSSCPFNNTSAEDFTLADTSTITRITWEGVYFGAGGSDFPGTDANFHVTVYEDNGSGNVAAIVADYPTVTVTKALSSRPAVFGTNPVYAYSAALPTPFAASGGQRYWVSINGNPNGASGPVFGWMASNQGNAASIPGNDQPLQNTSTSCAALPATTYNAGGTAGDQDSDLAFALYGNVGGGGSDCNFNNIPDECDIAAGTAGDCDTNGVIDECESGDCDSNGVPDNCDLVFGAADCNANDIQDKCEIAAGTASDCNGNDVPDDCELAGNDCNNNFIPDDCDIASGFSNDCQPDGIPDECQLYPQPGGNIIQDSGFEAGTPNPYWTEASTNFGTPLCDPTACNPNVGSGPHGGSWWCWFGGIAAFEAGSVEQTVIIPVGTTTIDFYFEIPTRSGNGTDFTRLLVDGNELWRVLENDPGFSTYTLVQVNISAYANGGSHAVKFDSVTSGTPGITNFFLDDISIFAPGGAPLNDCDNNGIPDDCENCADLDNDGDADLDDYNMFLAAFGRSAADPMYLPCADYDDSGAVGLLDYGNWLQCYRDFIGNPAASPPGPRPGGKGVAPNKLPPQAPLAPAGAPQRSRSESGSGGGGGGD